MASKRQRLAKHYDELLRDQQNIQIRTQDYSAIVPHIYVVRIKNMPNRKLLQQRLLDLGIQTGIHYQPNHVLSFYSEHRELPLPITESVFSELLSLPLHPDLNEDELKFVCTRLKEVIGDFQAK